MKPVKSGEKMVACCNSRIARISREYEVKVPVKDISYVAKLVETRVREMVSEERFFCRGGVGGDKVGKVLRLDPLKVGKIEIPENNKVIIWFKDIDNRVDNISGKFIYFKWLGGANVETQNVK